MSRKQKIILAAILILAAFFRFYQLADLPGGIFPDEAANGLDTTLMEQGQLQPFYERGNGREALFFYMLWGSIKAFGRSPLSHHLIPALIGFLSVIATFLVSKRLYLMVSEKVTELKANNMALLATFLMAVSSWHVVLSRTAFRAILIPLFVSLTFYLLLKTYQSQKLKTQLILSTLTGVSFALGFYTYIAYRILVPILLVLILWPLLASIKENLFKLRVKQYWKHFVLFLGGFLVFIYPLLKYFIDHPGSFVGRSGQVSVFNPELNGGNLIGTILEVLRLSVQGYFANGDLNWRHNISGEPFLPAIVSPFFGAALVVVTFLAARYMFSPLRNSRFWIYALLAGWFWGMLIPVITTAEGIPHGLRAIGTIPVVFIISALGLYKFGEWIYALHENIWTRVKRIGSINEKLLIRSFKLVIALFAVTLTLQSYFLYFVLAANSPSNAYWFRSDLTVVSDYLKKQGNKDNTYLVLDKFSVQTTEFLTTVDAKHPDNPRNQPYVQVDPENAWELTGLKEGDKIVFTQSSVFDTKKFKEFHPQARLSLEVRNKFGQTIMAVYKIKN